MNPQKSWPQNTLIQKRNRGRHTGVALLSCKKGRPDRNLRDLRADADVFFFDFYVALGGQLFQTGQNLPSAHLHPPANLGDSDQGVLFCKRAKLLQFVFLDFSFG